MKKVIVIFLAALLVRLVFVFFWHRSGNESKMSADANAYRVIAESIREGKGFQLGGVDTARRPPFYPFWISLIMRFSPFPLGIRLMDAVIGSLSCVLLYGIGRKLFGEKAGILGAGLMAIDYLSIRQAASVLSETSFVFFLLAGIYYFLEGEKQGKVRKFFLAGIFAGLSLLTRDVLILYYPVLAGSLLFLNGDMKRRLKCAILFLGGIALITAPWIVRNSLLYHRPTLITVSSGLTLYIANNPKATGGTTGGDWAWDKDSFLPPDIPYSLNTPEADRYLREKAVEFITGSPRQFLRLCGRKIVNTWRPYQLDSPLIVQLITGGTYIPVVILGIAGLFMSLSRWRELMPVYLLILYVFLLHAVLIAEIRYRYPVMPFFMLFAAYGFLRCRGSFQPGKFTGKTCHESSSCQ